MMPNGDDRGWVMLCAAIDIFRVRYGRWPGRVCVQRRFLGILRTHVFTTEGFAVVASVIDFAERETPGIVVAGADGESCDYKGQCPNPHPDPTTGEFFGQAVLHPTFRD
jgi:hypothetical protein